jgi:hypothetical protein
MATPRNQSLDTPAGESQRNYPVNSEKKLDDYRADDLIPSIDMPAMFPGTTDQTWNSLRHKGNGPKFVKVARRIYYRRCWIDAWLGANTMTRTDQPAESAAR